MTVIKQAGDDQSVGSQNVTQGQFREQINAINDAIRQIGGMPTIGTADAVVNEPLNTPYILYVNEDIGEDTFRLPDKTLPYPEGGPYDYSTQAGVPEDDRDPMRRISQQRLVAGYTEARPFKTLNRAIIEAGILTSRDYLERCCSYERTRVTIVVTGEMKVINDESDSTTCEAYFREPPYPDYFVPSERDLMMYNPSSGGLLLPRGVSVVSLDLRKSIIRPNQVPLTAEENSKKWNRQAIFKVTGAGYYYGFTFMDGCGVTQSHHLLDCFQFASKDELDEFYQKIKDKFETQIPFNYDLLEAQDPEYIIVGPNPDNNPTIATDTTESASPYVYNCSIRSELGLCGIFCDGDRVEGFKSLVTAQFTGVSLQTDPNAWEWYNPGKEDWEMVPSYEKVIETSPNDVRQRRGWRSFHIRAINRAVIQEVSVFAIGQGVHHWCENGGEITITNSNSNFGGVAALAEGYNPTVSQLDKGWTVEGVHRALNPFARNDSWGAVFLGTVASMQGNNIVLQVPLNESSKYPNEPELVRDLGYTLAGREGQASYIWIQNPVGPDYRARLEADPWNGGLPSIILVSEEFRTDDASNNTKPGSGEDFPELEGLQVYARRFTDNRSRDDRTLWLNISGCGDVLRQPYRDYVMQDQGDSWKKKYLSAVARSKVDQRGCESVQCVMRDVTYDKDLSGFNEQTWYRKGDVILYKNKHWSSNQDQYGPFNPENWNESYVHMSANFVPEGQILHVAPRILFDADLSESETSTNCGLSLTSPHVAAQIESATDFKGLRNLYQILGRNTDELYPQQEADQDLDLTKFKVNFHRPSNLRLFNHAWEWAGYLNYSKALPKYQQSLGPVNKFTYYFTNQNGGKCYVSGFNEEGFQVTSKGLVDLATGDEISAIDLGTPDQDVNNDVNIEFPRAKTLREFESIRTPEEALGDVVIAPIEQIFRSNSQRKTYLERFPDWIAEQNAKLDNQSRGVVKPLWLEQYLLFNGYLQAPSNDVAAIVIHVVPEGVTPLTGRDSVPYGYPASTSAGTQFSLKTFNAYGGPQTITEALRVAGRIYAPVGAEIIISLHGNISEPEVGPLQLVNSYAPVVVAGARGFVGNGSRGPIINLDRAVTKNALDRFPQFSSDYAFSAGLVFADTHLKCRGGQAIITFNGGFGMGLLDSVIEITDLEEYTLASASFGEKTSFAVYGEDNKFCYFDVIVNNGIADKTKVWLNFFGVNSSPDEDTGSGVMGHGVDLVIDNRVPQIGGNNSFKPVLRFTNNDTHQMLLSFLALGGRGGVRSGGRLAADWRFDFGGTDWDLSQWISEMFRTHDNYFGQHFRVPETSFNEGEPAVRTLFNMTNSTYDTIEDAKSCVLDMGCCIDVDKEGKFSCGPFGIYKSIEKAKGLDAEKSSDQDKLLLIAKNNHNAYVYTDGSYRNTNAGQPFVIPGSVDPDPDPDPDQEFVLTVSGGVYLVDGIEKPDLNLTPGTYTFDQSDSTNTGHPLYIRDSADDMDTSTSYGVTGSTGAYTSMTFTTGTYYYGCDVHPNMGGVIVVS